MQALATESTRTPLHHNLVAILSRRGFRRLLAVRVTSQLGDGVFQAGLAGSVFFNPERAASPVAIATAFAVLLVPYSLLGPFVGVFLDRWSRRQVLFAANTIRAAIVLPAAWFVWNGNEGMPFVTCALVIIALNRFFLSGLSASQPHVVEQRRLVTANSFATTLGSVVFSGGLAAAAGMFHLTGTGFHPYAAIASTAALWYAISAGLTLLSFPVDALGPDEAHRTSGSISGAIIGTARGMIAGVRHLALRPMAASVVVLQAANRGLYGILAMTTLLLYRNYYNFDNPEGSVAGLLPVAGAAAVGTLAAAILTPPMTRRLGGARWIVVMMAGLAVGVPALALPFHPWLTVAGAAALSVGTQAVKIVADTAIQVECDDEFRGRVFSVNDTAINAFFVGGLFVGAVVLPTNGHSPATISAVGGAYALLAVWYALATARRH
jgi:hypothetical protein